jgi:hypothetical protein
MPWRGTVSGGPEKLQREVQLRQNMQAKGAEHAGTHEARCLHQLIIDRFQSPERGASAAGLR